MGWITHVCACSVCDPRLDPDGPRLGENHCAVRFGESHLEVLKDGVVIRDCYEVIAGVDGRAWRVRSPAHHCSCHVLAPCLYIDHGHFTVRTPVRV